MSTYCRVKGCGRIPRGIRPDSDSIVCEQHYQRQLKEKQAEVQLRRQEYNAAGREEYAARSRHEEAVRELVEAAERYARAVERSQA